MTTRIHILLALFLLAVPAAAQPSSATLEVSQRVLDFWAGAVGRGDFRALLDAVDQGAAAPWPKAVSAAYGSAISPAAAADQARLRGLARRLLEQLAAHQQRIEADVSEAFALMRLRDHLTRAPSYVNLLLGDCVDRVLAAALAKSIVASGSVSEEAATAIAELRQAGADPRILVEVAEEELGRPVLEESLAGAEPAILYGRLIQTLTADLADDDRPPLEVLAGRGAYRLLVEQDLGALFSRWWMTGQRIHVVLPLLAEYVARAEDFSVADGYDKIRQTLPRTREFRAAFSSPLHRARPTSNYDVSHLLQAVREGSIDDFPALDLSPETIRQRRSGQTGRPAEAE